MPCLRLVAPCQLWDGDYGGAKWLEPHAWRTRSVVCRLWGHSAALQVAEPGRISMPSLVFTGCAAELETSPADNWSHEVLDGVVFFSPRRDLRVFSLHQPPLDFPCQRKDLREINYHWLCHRRFSLAKKTIVYDKLSAALLPSQPYALWLTS
jgi:hypothetical protein